MSDPEVVQPLARLLYVDYCTGKGFKPHRPPYVPAWALEYARTSVDVLGWDDEALDVIQQRLEAQRG